MRPHLARAIEQEDAVGVSPLPLGVNQSIGRKLGRLRADTVAGGVGVRARLLAAALAVGSGPSLGGGTSDRRQRRLELVGLKQRLERHGAVGLLVPDQGLERLVRMGAAGIGIGLGRKT